MQGWRATKRHGVTRKRKNRLKQALLRHKYKPIQETIKSLKKYKIC